MRVKRTAPLQIIFRNLDPSGAVENKIQERLAKLETYCEHITNCRVTVEVLNGNARSRLRYHIGIVAQVLGRELVADCESDGHMGGAYIYVPIHDAFDAIRRQILQFLNEDDASPSCVTLSEWMPAVHSALCVDRAEISGYGGA